MVLTEALPTYSNLLEQLLTTEILSHLLAVNKQEKAPGGASEKPSQDLALLRGGLPSFLPPPPSFLKSSEELNLGCCTC